MDAPVSEAPAEEAEELLCDLLLARSDVAWFALAAAVPDELASSFDWHADPITRTTPGTSKYRNTQTVQRFLRSQCRASFQSNRRFMTWIKDRAVERPTHFAETDARQKT